MPTPSYAKGLHLGEIVAYAVTSCANPPKDSLPGTPPNKQIEIVVKVLGVPTDDGSYEPHEKQWERRVKQTITPNTLNMIGEMFETLQWPITSYGEIDSEAHPSFGEGLGVGQQILLWNNPGPEYDNFRISTGGGVGGAAEFARVQQQDTRKLDQQFGAVFKRGGSAPRQSPPARGAAQSSSPRPQSGHRGGAAAVAEKGDPFDASMGITDDDVPF